MWLPVRKVKETSSFLERVTELQKQIKMDSFAPSKQYHHQVKSNFLQKQIKPVVASLLYGSLYPEDCNHRSLEN